MNAINSKTMVMIFLVSQIIGTSQDMLAGDITCIFIIIYSEVINCPLYTMNIVEL